jgi:ParB family transcriptional regulator, chromosome partitioning protein
MAQRKGLGKGLDALIPTGKPGGDTGAIRGGVQQVAVELIQRQLVEDFGLSHESVAKRVGKSRVAVTNTLRLLGLADAVKQALVDGKITEGHARALLALSTQKAQASALQTVLNLSLSVRQTEELTRKLGGHKPIKAKKPHRSADVGDVEKRLQKSLGTKVALKYSKKGGTVTIYYYSDEELDSLLNKLT